MLSAMAMSMTPAMQAEIKILPGNDKCVDCGSAHPQWASVTFGALMCLECSGAHRGMGVHISFVRSVTMDSWNEKQLALMKAGGNADLVAFWKRHKVDPRMPHNAKYHEPASELYKDRLRAKVEGKPLPTELPARKAAPASCYDAPGGSGMSAGGFGGGDRGKGAGGGGGHGGGGDAKGSEALKGETEEQYVARQRRLQAEARERMRAKFGGGGMGGVGSNSDYNPATGGYGSSGGGFNVAAVSDTLKGWGAALNDDERAQQLKAQTAETAKAAWGGLKSWTGKLTEGVKNLAVREDDASDLGAALAMRRSSGALGTGKQMDGVGSGMAGFGSDNSTGSFSGGGGSGFGSGSSMQGFGSQNSFSADAGLDQPTTFGRSESQQSFGSRSNHSAGSSSHASDSLRPEAPARSASNPSPPLPPPAPRADRSASTQSLSQATPGKAKKLAIDDGDDFFSDFGV